MLSDSFLKYVGCTVCSIEKGVEDEKNITRVFY